MKLTALAALLCAAILTAPASAAPFVNLDFEQATVPPGTGQFLDASLAFPGWVLHVGNHTQTTAYYDYAGIGEGCVVLYDRPLDIGGFPVIQGRFSAALLYDGAFGEEASLSQVGDVPPGAQSLRFVGPPRSPALISIDGNLLPLVAVSNPVTSLPTWAVDVTAFAGSTVELRLTSKYPYNQIAGADGLTFSSEPVPEPCQAVVVALAASVFAAFHRRPKHHRRICSRSKREQILPVHVEPLEARAALGSTVPGASPRRDRRQLALS